MNTRHSSERGSAVAPPPLAWVATLMGWMGEAFRLSERSIGPVVDLLIRLRLAQIFFVSSVLKAADFEHAIYLSTHEYPVSWMDPVTAAYLGVAIELGGSVLLAVGLATRLAAVAMLALSWVIQLNYVALDTNLFWAALFGWYVARGAGSLSLDHALSRGLADSALPLAKTIIGFSDWVTRYFRPLFHDYFNIWVLLAEVDRGRYQGPGNRARRATCALRLPRAGHGCQPQLFWPRRMGAVCTGF